MKKFRFAFMSLPLLLFIPSCTNNGEKAEVSSSWNDSLIKETDFESHSKTKLLTNEIASSNKKGTNEEEHVIDNNKYWWESDSVYATKMYEFNYADSIFPCQPPCIIKGLDTDGEGSFYIAGGNPIRLNCYKETEMVPCYQHRLMLYRGLSPSRGRFTIFYRRVKTPDTAHSQGWHR